MSFAVTLASSSAGNATLFSNGKTHILLDAGLGIRHLTRALSQFSLTPNELSGIVISHAHGDHTKSLEFLPKDIPVYCSPGTAKRLVGVTPVMQGQIFEIDDVQMSMFATPHDCIESTGFLLQYGEKSMALVTDLGHMPREILELLSSVPTVFLESNYCHELLINGPYPWFLKKRIGGEHGHLSNDECAETVAYCAERGVLQNLVLMHLSKENNTPERALQTTVNRLAKHPNVQVQVAPRSEACVPVKLC